MKGFSTILLVLPTFLAASCVGSDQTKSHHFNSAAKTVELATYEMQRTVVVPIKDSRMGRQYELYIKLPEEYADNAEVKYPVIYTTDADVHMEMLSGSTEFLMPNVILVGISYQKDLGDEWSYASRFRDYTVTKYSNPERQERLQGGQANHHLRFIRDDVIAYVETKYRTEPNEHAYFGYSLGAAFGAYILFAQPDTFSYYILGSPAFTQSNFQYVADLEAKAAHLERDLDVDVFVSLGEREERAMERTDQFMSMLNRGSHATMRVTGLEVIKGSDHTAAFPETVIRGVKWLSEQLDK